MVSPCPGTPARASDIGLCREIIEQGDLPVLGVCLGHQAIAHLLGGVVGRAPEPRHGRVSPVLHKQVDVFAGLPSPFEAVRYHSLAATDLPDDLEPIAWTPDGVLMGLRHRQRPLWGVQFHPESISTEHGHRLLANFADLTRGHQGRTRSTARTEPATSPALVKKQEPRTRLRVHVETLQTRWDDEVVFATLFGDCDQSFWLDSSRQDHGIGRYSVLGCADGPLARTVVADTQRGTSRCRARMVAVTSSRASSSTGSTVTCAASMSRCRIFPSTSLLAGWAISDTSSSPSAAAIASTRPLSLTR